MVHCQNLPVAVSHLNEYGGKDVRAVVRHDQDRGHHQKPTLDVVASDGTVYRWSRFSDGEPWTFEHRETADGQSKPTRYTLPATVSAFVTHRDDVRY